MGNILMKNKMDVSTYNLIQFFCDVYVNLRLMGKGLAFF
jgi:hypothetical protein